MESGDTPTSKNKTLQDDRLIHNDGGSRTIHTRANQYVYNMPGQSWRACWVIAGLADAQTEEASESHNFFSLFPAEIRYSIMDYYLGASTGTGHDALGIYLALRTKQIYWWEPYLYTLHAGGNRRTLELNGVVVPKEMKYPSRSYAMHIIFLKVMDLDHSRSADILHQEYDNLVALRDRILTHPRTIEITSKIIARWDHRVASQARK